MFNDHGMGRQILFKGGPAEKHGNIDWFGDEDVLLLDKKGKEREGHTYW